MSNKNSNEKLRVNIKDSHEISSHKRLPDLARKAHEITPRKPLPDKPATPTPPSQKK